MMKGKKTTGYIYKLKFFGNIVVGRAHFVKSNGDTIVFAPGSS